MMHCKSIAMVFGIIAILFGLGLIMDLMQFTVEMAGLIILLYGIVLVIASYMTTK